MDPGGVPEDIILKSDLDFLIYDNSIVYDYLDDVETIPRFDHVCHLFEVYQLLICDFKHKFKFQTQIRRKFIALLFN